MLLLGILAVIQTIFLPGFILISVFRIKTTSIIQKWIYVFALSLFSNYALVTGLTLIGFYKSIVIYFIIVIEVITIVYLLLTKKCQINFNINFGNILLEYFSFIKSLSASGKVLIITTTIVILFYFSLFISNIGTIFYFVDTVNNIHWNTWAIDFANNTLPNQSSHFPQLIPSNWSISYLLIGESNVHFFPKSFMPLFFFGNLLMFLDLAISKKNYVYYIGLIIYGLFAPILYSLVFIADGNGDLPVSFFAFLSFYAYLKTDKEKFVLKEYILVFLFASTAAGTKLAGFYVFSFMSILCLYYLMKNFKVLNRKEVTVLFSSVIFILSINLFWYFLKPEVMTGGLHQPEWLAAGYSNILKNALHLLYYNIGLPVLVFFILTFLFSLFVKESRYITIFFVLPPIILWMFKYSADFRNLSFVVPFISYVSAFGLVKIYKIIRNSQTDLILRVETLKENISNKRILKVGICCFVLSPAFFFLINTNAFYQTLYWIYSSINKYYFQSNRITYFTDYTFFIHVDYYQKVLAMMFLVLSLTSLLYILKIKIRDVLVIMIAVSVFLNFTFVTKSDILKHQQNEFAKVDARNYYPRINTIIKSAKFDNKIFTNFHAICSEKTPRDIEFYYMDKRKIYDSLSTLSGFQSKQYFLRLDDLQDQTKEIIQHGILNQRFKLLYDDGDYLLISN